uniref:GPR180/TMEM145 transmembrane domain-containing protein n=1 Tax=Romanomermis culicivorax TaxID=13658 RepID=A0A915HXK8_ROMCU
SSCRNSLNLLANLAFDFKCNKKGEQDIFRRLPCLKGKLCPDEDQAQNVFPNFQFTYRIQDRSQSRFWYLILFNCFLDENCTWQRANYSRKLTYEINLINGHPLLRNSKIFFDTGQLSIDERYLPQIGFFGLIFTSILLILTLKISTKSGQFLKLILISAICQHFCWLTHYLSLSRNGVGWPFLKFAADQILNHVVEYLLIFLLILIAKGWKIRTLVVKRRLKTWTLMSCLFCLHLTFNFWALLTNDFWLYASIYDVWQGWAVLVVRLSATCWFFVELRSSVKLERDEQKRTFLLHFGSGFLVWFVYLPILGAFSGNISLINRLEIVQGLHHLANFVVCATLTHLFYPKSASRKFFLKSDHSTNDSLNFEEEDLAILDDDFEKSYFTPTMEDLDHVTDVVDCSKT